MSKAKILLKRENGIVFLYSYGDFSPCFPKLVNAAKLTWFSRSYHWFHKKKKKKKNKKDKIQPVSIYIEIRMVYGMCFFLLCYSWAHTTKAEGWLKKKLNYFLPPPPRPGWLSCNMYLNLLWFLKQDSTSNPRHHWRPYRRGSSHIRHRKQKLIKFLAFISDKTDTEPSAILQPSLPPG